jgi:hypothetical protein
MNNIFAQCGSKNNLVTKVYNEVRNRIINGEIHLVINKNLPNSIFGGAEFSVDDKNNKYISLSPYLLEIQEKHPTIVYSILIHEFQHASDFFNNNLRFQTSKTNRLEKYLYEMDAFFVEGMFISDVLTNCSKYKTTKFENFLAHSLSQDNMQHFSLSLLGTDMNLVHALFKISESTDASTVKIEKIKTIGNNILSGSKFPNSGDAWSKYLSIIPFYTFRNYIPQIMFNIESQNASRRLNPADFDLKRYPAISEIDDNMILVIEKYSSYYEYKNELTKHFIDLN